jgi:tetratricopeptide (TPR) repeat protein
LTPSTASTTTRATTRRPKLRISFDQDSGVFYAIEHGHVDDGHLPEQDDEVVEDVFVFYLGRGDRAAGFGVIGLYKLPVEEYEEELFTDAPRFDVPSLGLRVASVGEIILAARPTLAGFSTPNVVLFDHAVQAGQEDDLEQAEFYWRACLQTGELKAHYGLGYTLYEQGRHREAYGHLRTYTEIAPKLSWSWVWHGRAAERIGEPHEAARCYRRAIKCERDGSEETNAAALLKKLERRERRRARRKARESEGLRRSSL